MKTKTIDSVENLEAGDLVSIYTFDRDFDSYVFCDIRCQDKEVGVLLTKSGTNDFVRLRDIKEIQKLD